MITFKQYLIESRYAPLYHATHFEVLDDILDEGLYAETSQGISAARNISSARWYMSHEFSMHKGYVIIELDHNRIRQRYKVLPYDYYMQPHIQAVKMRRKEAEEIILVGRGNYLETKYFKQILYFRKDLDEVKYFMDLHPKMKWKEIR